MPPASITELTDSEPDCDAAPAAPLRGVKRKRLDFDDPLALQVLLSQPCASQGCTKRCKEHFRKSTEFTRFLDFRKKWKTYHKLDRDQMATCVAMCVAL